MGAGAMSWFKKLQAGLKKTSEKLTTGFSKVLAHKKVDALSLEQLEELLLQSDMGVRISQELTEALRKSRWGQDVTEEDLKDFLAQKLEEILVKREGALTTPHQKPRVFLMVGVNGGGKTTTLAKLGAMFQDQGLKVMFAAGDTFRAAAVEQLKAWGDRVEIPVVFKETGADAAGLAHDAYVRAKKEGMDILLIDTAGRLHNNAGLMRELEKIARVLKKLDPDCPHEVLLTLDATTGQNAVVQVEEFGKLFPLTGLVMTKLDGTAKGGMLVQIAERFEIPILFLGVGEKIEDLLPFQAKDFAKNLVGS